MKFSTSTILSLLSYIVTAQLPHQTGTFGLQLVSTDAKWNGQYLAACHEGAAIEGLCPYGLENKSSFNFNYSSDAVDPTTLGFLTYTLRGGNFNVSQPLKLSYDPTTNIAVPLFYPDNNGQFLGFNVDDFMFIQGFDDTVQPRNLSTVKPYYRWYVCQTFAGYLYNTLAWGLGRSEPQNPTCSKVEVKRIWI